MKQPIPFLVILLLASLACNKDDNPLQPGGQTPFFFGSVVNANGAAVESVGVHFIPHLDPSPFTREQANAGDLLVVSETNPTTTIAFDLPADGIVTLILYRYGSNDLIDTLLNHEPMFAGTNEAALNARALTNGIYYYRLFVNDTLHFTGNILLIAFFRNDSAAIASVEPLRITNHMGQFTLPYAVFGVGLKFAHMTAASVMDTITVVDSLDLVLYKPGFKVLIQGMKIDTTQTFVGTFTLHP